MSAVIIVALCTLIALFSWSIIKILEYFNSWFLTTCVAILGVCFVVFFHIKEKEEIEEQKQQEKKISGEI